MDIGLAVITTKISSVDLTVICNIYHYYNINNSVMKSADWGGWLWLRMSRINKGRKSRA